MLEGCATCLCPVAYKQKEEDPVSGVKQDKIQHKKARFFSFVCLFQNTRECNILRDTFLPSIFKEKLNHIFYRKMRPKVHLKPHTIE